MKSKTDLLMITATKIESQAVMDVFRKATGKGARPERIADRVYHDLGEINDTRVFLGLSEMGSSGLGASQQEVQKGIDSLKPWAVIMVGTAFGVNEHTQEEGNNMVAHKKLMTNGQIVTHFAEKFEVSKKAALSIIDEYAALAIAALS